MLPYALAHLATMSVDARAASGSTVRWQLSLTGHCAAARNSRLSADWVLAIFCGGTKATKTPVLWRAAVKNSP
jgi:hypothetical protein